MRHAFVYSHVRGPEAAATLMNRNGNNALKSSDVLHQRSHHLKLADTCYWEIAHSANPLIFHSRIAAERVARETGVGTKRICFVPYHLPLATDAATK